MDLAGVIIGSLGVLAVLLLMLTRTLVIINQASTGVVERLGRFQRTLSPGLTILIPFVDRIRDRVDMREQVVFKKGYHLKNCIYKRSYSRTLTQNS